MRCRRKIDLVAVIFAFYQPPVVAVAADIGFGCRLSFDQLQQVSTVNETGDLAYRPFLNRASSHFLRIVMTDKKSGLFWIIRESPLEPGHLGLAEFSLDLVHEAKGVEQDPVCERGFNNGALLADDSGFFCRRERGFVEIVSIVVVTQGAVDRDSSICERFENPDEGRVIARLAIIERAIAVDNDSGD